MDRIPASYGARTVGNAAPAVRSEVGLHPGEELAGDDDALHLVGAFVDLGDLGVAHHPLDRVVAGVAVAAEHLYGVRRDLHRHVGGEALGRGPEEREVGVSALGAAGGG